MNLWILCNVNILPIVGKLLFFFLTVTNFILHMSLRVKTWIYTDNYNRKSYTYAEINKAVLRSLRAKTTLPLVNRMYWNNIYHRYGKFYSLSYQRKGCQTTSSGRSVFAQFKGSRHKAKQWGALGWLPGMRKSSF